MKNLRKQLNNILKEVHPQVYFKRAKVGAVYPYIIFDLPNSASIEDMELINLDIDVWDNSTDTTIIEDLATDIWDKLNRLHYVDEDMSFGIYRMARLSLNDEDDIRLNRRLLTFNIRYYKRGAI